MDSYLDKDKVLLVQISIVLYISKYLNVFIEIKYSVVMDETEHGFNN